MTAHENVAVRPARADYFRDADSAEIEYWKGASAWSVAELEAMCCGLVPLRGRPSTEALNRARRLIERAVQTGDLPSIEGMPDGAQMHSQGPFVRPDVATRWASVRYEEFPFQPSDFGHVEDGFGEIAPEDRPPELDIAMQAWRAVFQGYGNGEGTFRARLAAWLDQFHPRLSAEAKKRIVIVANPSKEPGRPKK